MITLNKFLIFLGLSFSFFLNGIPNTELPVPIVQPKTFIDNTATVNGKECEVITTDHKLETYIDGQIPKFTNYFTPKAKVTCKDLNIVDNALLIPVDWIHSITQNIESLPEAFKKYALNKMPEIPVYAIPYISKIYPGKSYLVLTTPPSLKEQAIKYIQEHSGRFKKEQLEALPQELKEKLLS